MRGKKIKKTRKNKKRKNRKREERKERKEREKRGERERRERKEREKGERERRERKEREKGERERRERKEREKGERERRERKEREKGERERRERKEREKGERERRENPFVSLFFLFVSSLRIGISFFPFFLFLFSFSLFSLLFLRLLLLFFFFFFFLSLLFPLSFLPLSRSGTPHAQRIDACTVFHVSAYACGAGVFSFSAQRTLSPFLRLFLLGCPHSLRVGQRARLRGTLRGLDAVDPNFDHKEPGYGYGFSYSGCIFGMECYDGSIVFSLFPFSLLDCSQGSTVLLLR